VYQVGTNKGIIFNSFISGNVGSLDIPKNYCIQPSTTKVRLKKILTFQFIARNSIHRTAAFRRCHPNLIFQLSCTSKTKRNINLKLMDVHWN